MAAIPNDLDGNPRPSDPPFLFCVLLAARSAGDRVLESLARDWLAEAGIRVMFAKDYVPSGREGAK